MSPLIFPLPISFPFPLSPWTPRLSTPRSHAFAEIPWSSGNKPPLCCSCAELGSVGVEHPLGFRAPHRCSRLSLFSAQMFRSGVAVPRLCPSCRSRLCILLSVSLQHHHLWLSASLVWLSPCPLYTRSSLCLFPCGPCCLVYNLQSRRILPNKWINIRGDNK